MKKTAFLALILLCLSPTPEAIEVHFINECAEETTKWKAPRGIRKGVSRKTHYYTYDNIRLNYGVEGDMKKLPLPNAIDGKAIGNFNYPLIVSTASPSKFSVTIAVDEHLENQLDDTTQEQLLFKIEPTNNTEKFIVTFKGLELGRGFENFSVAKEHVKAIEEEQD